MVSAVLKRASEILAPIAGIYSHRLGQYGAAPRGVFWKTEEGQRLRFDVLMGAFDAAAEKGGITINDLGCGYGACLGCAVPHVEGHWALCCKDGPVFDLDEVRW